jgi:chromosome segregation ATPase
MAPVIDVTGNDEYIRAIARNEAKVEGLVDVIRELKRTIEELVDRMDADIDTLRTKSEAFAVVAAAVDDLRRRVTIVETKFETQTISIAKLETKVEEAIVDKAKIETKLESLSARVYWASGAAAVLAWLASRLFK